MAIFGGRGTFEMPASPPVSELQVMSTMKMTML